MICPFRVDVTFTYADAGDHPPVCISQKESFPQCMEDECPFYDKDYVTYVGNSCCTRIGSRDE